MSVDNQKKSADISAHINTNNHITNSSSLSSVSSISPKNVAANNLKVLQLNMQKNTTTNGSTTSSGSSSTNSSTYVKNKSGSGANQIAKQMVIHDGTNLADLDVQKLPANIKFELDQLELELLEGDITQKGYDKKRAKLLEAYVKSISMSKDVSSSNTQSNSDSKDTNESTKTKEKIRVYRKKNKDEPNPNRYHSG
jgi:hypothetical protein